jgi:spectinomycin phosphotransferase
VECTKGSRYFLKLHGTTVQPPFAASSFDFYLPLTYQLHIQRILPHIPHPIPTLNMQLSIHVGKLLLVLSNFIEGTIVGHNALTDNTLARLANMLGTLHRRTPEVNLPYPLTEHFDIVFEDTLVTTTSKLDRILSSKRHGLRLLRDTLLLRREEILRYLQRLKKLQRAVRETQKPMVICHPDLHGENLMVDDQGHLYILDWENAMIAPPEHDLFFFAGYESFWWTFLPNYTREFYGITLDPDFLGFYYYRQVWKT